MSICKPEADPKDLHLQVDLRAKRPWVWVDQVRIEQALWNVVQNAVKFTPAHGTITVRSLDSPEGRFALTVSNTGRGIPNEDLARIFLPFEQVPDAASGRGLGLGLAISKGIVDAAGGRLTAQSEGPESGASFTMELPARVAPASEGARSPSQPAGRRLRILLVEDDPDTRETLSELLRASDYDVETADSVASAERGFGGDRFDLVLSDLGLPDGSGYDLLAKLKARHPVRAIALSGYGMAEDVKRSQAAGFLAHLTKPISLDELMAAIREVTA
jgi:CheY-like chemotaxis protein